MAAAGVVAGSSSSTGGRGGAALPPSARPQPQPQPQPQHTRHSYASRWAQHGRGDEIRRMRELRASVRDRVALVRSDGHSRSSGSGSGSGSALDTTQQRLATLSVEQRDKRRQARQHPRWAELMSAEEAQGQEADAATRQPGEPFPRATPLRLLLGPAYIPAEETVRNDYAQHYVDTGGTQLPGSAVRNPALETRFLEYPKLRRLVDVKTSVLEQISHPPTYLQADLLPSLGPASPGTGDSTFHLAHLAPVKYDVVVIDPPLEAYEWEGIPCSDGGHVRSATPPNWSWDQVAALPIPQIVARESFVFLWVGAGTSDGLERGREVLMRWGFRRCEDIVWAQTNKSDPEHTGAPDGQGEPRRQNSQRRAAPASSAFASSTQHCLMGIRGTVRRSTDTNFVHCNIDTDVILWQGEHLAVPAEGASEGEQQAKDMLLDARSKPPELMAIAENFCLGTRRLELFGRNRNLRRGWLTVGLDVGPGKADWDAAEQGQNACAAAARQGTPVPYDRAAYSAHFSVDRPGCPLAERSNLVPYQGEIDELRPKSPRRQPAEAAAQAAAVFGADQRGLSSTAGPAFGPYAPDVARQGSHVGPGPAMLPPYGGYAAGALGNVQGDAMWPRSAQPSGGGGGGGGGLSGLGAGGPSVVSKQSGSELLSGAQAHVLLGQHSAQRLPGGEFAKSASPSVLSAAAATAAVSAPASGGSQHAQSKRAVGGGRGGDAQPSA